MLKRLKKNYFLLVSTFLILYFFFNLMSGQRGLISYFEKKNDIDGPIDTKMDVLSSYVGGFNIFWPKYYLIRQGSNLKLYNSTIR